MSVLKGIAFTGLGGLAGLQIGKKSERKKKKLGDKKLNKKVAQILATSRNTRIGRV